MGNPEKQLCGFHVGGTNGKGSVCASLEALALANNQSTALNTSPHLINYTERFRINGKELDFSVILSTFQHYEKLFEKWDASFFEITTAIAFAIFKQQNPDVAIIEVGLGGRLDATNLWTPDVMVITNIGLDHVKTLGGTLEIIAGEKAGIIKAGIPVVLGDMEPSPLAIIEGVALAKQAPVFRYGKDWSAEIVRDKVSGLSFNYSFGSHHFKRLQANLMGDHQAVNIGSALTAYLLFAQKIQLKVTEATIRTALRSINWQGRMQLLSTTPVIIVDGAHNVHGIKALKRSLDNIYPGRKLKFLISILADKDYSEMIHLICSMADTVYIAQNQSDRAATVEAQLAEVQKHGVVCKAAGNVEQALQLALSECSPQDVLVAGGSLYTVGEVLQAYKANA
jgi:dihydrofolate synthase/folylpolyglutamate synthase